MFKNIYYNPTNSKIYLWEVGQTKPQIFPYQHTYWIGVPEEKSNTEMKAFDGSSLKEITLKRGERISNHAKQVSEMGVDSYELSAKPTMKFLHSHYGTKELKFDFKKDFTCLEFDIETSCDDDVFPDPENVDYPVNLINMRNSRTKTLIVFALYEYTGDFDKSEYPDHIDHVEWYTITDELDLLNAFFKRFRKEAPDILTGWFINGYDIPYLVRRIAKLEPSCIVSDSDSSTTYRLGAPMNTWKYNKNKDSWEVPGLSILDYLDVYKNYTYEMLSSYSLENVCQHVLGEGKIKKPFGGKMGEFWRKDWNLWCEYCIKDTILIPKLEDKLGFLALITQFCSQSKVPLESNFSSVAMINGRIMAELRNERRVMPDVRNNAKSETVTEELEGGYVMATKGLHKFEISNDFESLYPRLINALNVSPEMKIIDLEISKDEALRRNYIISPIDGIYYRKDEEGFIPRIVNAIFAERKYWKEEMKKAYNRGDKAYGDFCFNQQLIRKILINSFYGAMGFKNFPFYDLDNANVITAGGRSAIQFCSKAMNKKMSEISADEMSKMFPEYDCSRWNGDDKEAVRLIDTDSNYTSIERMIYDIAPPECQTDNDAYLKFAQKVDVRFLTPFFLKANQVWAKRHNARAVLNFKREKIILKQFVMAKKKYVTISLDNEGVTYDKPKTDYTGIDVRRTDASDFTRKYAEGVIQMVMDELPMEDLTDHLKALKKEFKKSPLKMIANNKGVKNLEKYPMQISELDENALFFESGSPIHVRASHIFNYMNQQLSLGLTPISSKSLEKVSYVYTTTRNRYGVNVVGFVGETIPEEIEKEFVIDYDLQFEKTFLGFVERMFEAMKWPKPNLNIITQSFFS